MKKAMLIALLVVAPLVAQAATRKDVESSAVVKGSIVLAKDGTVQSAVIDDEANVGKPIAEMVRKAALQWRFEPVLRDGEPVVAKSSMSVRVVLKERPDGDFVARIKGATFGDSSTGSTDVLRNAERNKQMPPRYPAAAVLGGAQGTVYLALRVDRSGHLVDAVAEQVNLENIGSDRLLKQYRELLAESALKAARQWTFLIPTTGPLAGRDHWSVRVPINYALSDRPTPRPKRTWVTYVPGPFTPAPWVDKPDMNAADALADGALLTDGAGPILLSPLGRD